VNNGILLREATPECAPAHGGTISHYHRAAIDPAPALAYSRLMAES